MTPTFLDRVRDGLIVSCQAPDGSPLRGRGLMAVMAEAAAAGGAAAIRAEGLADIRSIRAAVDLPILGLIKAPSEGTPVIITPLLEHVVDLVEAGADMIAVDATLRRRVDGSLGPEFVARARELGVPILADIDEVDAAVESERQGADAVSTTLAGYTGGPVPLQPDLDLIVACVRACSVPVIAEGRFSTPEEVSQAFAAGAWAVCVGGAITDPWKSTQRFVSQMHAHRSGHGATA